MFQLGLLQKLMHFRQKMSVISVAKIAFFQIFDDISFRRCISSDAFLFKLIEYRAVLRDKYAYNYVGWTGSNQ